MNIVNGLFSSLTVPEQVEAARNACVVLGAHGAGLSHVAFMEPGTYLVELQGPAHRNLHFRR